MDMNAFGAGAFMNPMMMQSMQSMMMAGMFGQMPGQMPGMFGAGAGGSWGAEGGKGQGKGKRRFSRSRSRGRDDSPDREGRITENIAIPRNLMGRVIGKAGVTIKKIREESGARVEAEDSSEAQGEFKIRGSPEEVEKAKKLITEVANKAAAEKAVGGGNGFQGFDDGPYDGPSDNVEYPVGLMGGIIGAKGCKIMEVRQKSGCRINVERLETTCKVQFQGTLDQIDEAKAMVKKIAEEVEDNAAAIEAGDAVTEHMEFPGHIMGRIIGAKGAAIAEVRSQTGSRVSVDREDDRCKVKLEGTESQNRKAREMIEALVAAEGEGATGGGGGAGAGGGGGGSGAPRGAGGNFRGPRTTGSQIEDFVDVPQYLVGRVIGKGGETIQRLQKESGARIDVDTKSGDPCSARIQGSRDAVMRARYALAEVMERWGGPAYANATSQVAWAADGWGGPGYGWGVPPAGDGSMYMQAQWPPAGPPPGGAAFSGGADPSTSKAPPKEIDLDEL